MLYRIQTLYLSVSILFYFICSLLSGDKKSHYILQNMSICVTVSCLILSILSVFLFKKRKTQIVLNDINIFLNIVNYFTMLFFLDFQSYNEYYLELRVLFFLLLSFFCNILLYMANHAIKKDMNIIDSVNRIR